MADDECDLVDELIAEGTAEDPGFPRKVDEALAELEQRRDGDDERDLLDELIEERTARNPGYPRLLEAAAAERQRRRERGKEV